jgi:hypothetical protein
VSGIAPELETQWLPPRCRRPTRQQLAEYLLRAPLSLGKITWVEKTRRVIYRSSRSWRTKRNFEVFIATEFLSVAVGHIPPKNQHTGWVLRTLLDQVPGMGSPGVAGHGDGDQASTVPALFSWVQEEQPETIDTSHVPSQAPKLTLDDERILVLDGDPGPPGEFFGS